MSLILFSAITADARISILHTQIRLRHPLMHIPGSVRDPWRAAPARGDRQLHFFVNQQSSHLGNQNTVEQSLLFAKATVTSGDVPARRRGLRATHLANSGFLETSPLWWKWPSSSPSSPDVQTKHRQPREKRFRCRSLRTAASVVLEETTRMHAHTRTLTRDTLTLLVPDYNSMEVWE